MTAPFDMGDGDVVVVIGTGAGGGTLANALAQKGISVVALEAGGRYLPEDYVNDEWDSFAQLAWTDTRKATGSWRVARDFGGLPTWIVKAVGGSTTHWAGASIRFQDHEWKALTSYGAVEGATLLDWPIDAAEMAPWYDRAEAKMGVTRTGGRPGLPGNNNYLVLEKGAKALGYEDVHTGRMAINALDFDGRAACQQTGFCFQGCKWGAKWSTAYTEIPAGEATGNLEVRERCHAARIEHDEAGRVTGVVYFDADGAEQRQAARVVCVAGNSIETPRLLLQSTSGRFPNGLANESDQVGRNYMRHLTASVYAIFDKPVRMWRGTTMAGIVADESRHDPSRGFVAGYEMETLSLGLPFMAAFLNPGAWGREFTTALDGYENMAGMWIVGEDMPQATNRVTLDEAVLDQHGLPTPVVHYDDHPNDVAMRDHAYARGMAIYDAVGATRTMPTPPYPSTHNLGTARMSDRPEDGVVDRWGRAHDVPNLYVSDGSVFTTGAAENPTLTIVALAMRQADHIAREMSAGAL